MELPGEQLVVKLWDSLVDRGVSALLRPWNMRREARAQVDIDRLKQLSAAQTAIEVARIQAAHASSGTAALHAPLALLGPADLSNPHETPDSEKYSVLRAASLLHDVRLLGEELNVARAILAAEQELLKQECEIPSETIEEDWLTHWRDGASRVTSGDLQALWGRVLAGEASSPGEYSLRTLSFLRNLTQSEARKIAALAPFVISGGVYSGIHPLLRKNGIEYVDLLELESMGFIRGVSGETGLKAELESQVTGSFRYVLYCHEKVMIIDHSIETRSVLFPLYSLTNVGNQILNLGTFVANEDMLREIADYFKLKEYSVSVGPSHVVTEQNYETIHFPSV